MRGVTFMLDCKYKEESLVTTYHEKKIDKTLYRITSVYLGQFEFDKVFEDLIVKKILRDESFCDGRSLEIKNTH